MSLFRVTINYRYEMMTFLVERGVMAYSAKEALQIAYKILRLGPTVYKEAQAYQTWDKSHFDRDALLLACLNSDGRSVSEIIDDHR